MSDTKLKKKKVQLKIEIIPSISVFLITLWSGFDQCTEETRFLLTLGIHASDYVRSLVSQSKEKELFAAETVST